MQKKNENKMTIDKNGQLLTRVTVAQLPLNSKKPITQLQFMHFKEALVFTEKLPQ
jgi:hypothetical protein